MGMEFEVRGISLGVQMQLSATQSMDLRFYSLPKVRGVRWGTLEEVLQRRLKIDLGEEGKSEGFEDVC